MYKYPFTNALTFALVMQDLKMSKGLLQLIFPERKIKELRRHGPDETVNSHTAAKAGTANVDVEKTLIVGIELRKVRLDVMFEDSDEWFDIEMQCRNEYNVPKRTRYAHGIMDVHNLKAGQDFNDLKTSYVIFLCCFDVFARGEAAYRFSMFDEEKHLSLGDESYTIILNSKACDPQIPEPLRQLFMYMNEEIVTGDNKLLLQIDEAVQSWNTGERLEYIMTLEQEMLIKEAKARKEGYAEGHSEGENIGDARRLVETVDEVAANSGRGHSHALELCGVSEEEYLAAKELCSK